MSHSQSQSQSQPQYHSHNLSNQPQAQIQSQGQGQSQSPSHGGQNVAHNHDNATRLLAGIFSGAATAVCTAPLDLVKTRLQAHSLMVTQDKQHSHHHHKNFHHRIPANSPRRAVFPLSSINITNTVSTVPAYEGAVPRSLASAFVNATVPPNSWSSTSRPSAMQVLHGVMRQDGLKGCFSGLGVTLLGFVPNWAIYFSSYGYLKDRLALSEGRSLHPQITQMLAAAAAGAITCCATSPFWVIKVRLQTQTSNQQVYRGIAHAFRKIYRQEGLQGFYKGLPASFIGISHVAIQFPLYEWLKDSAATSPNVPISNAQLVLAATVSKLVAGSITYPHEVIRTCMQRQGVDCKYKGVFNGLQLILREEGVQGLYKGMSANLLKTVPSCVITFLCYEKVMQFIKS